MTLPEPRLTATCWTSAGDAAPGVGDERSPHSMKSRMEAAVAAGWHGFGIVHADLVAFRDSEGLRALRALADDTGIEHLELEFIGDWWTTGPRRAASDTVRRDLFEAAEVLGVPTIKVAAAMDGPPPTDLMLTELDRLATQARERGTRVAIEPMPFSTNIRTMKDGADVLAAISNPSLGLVLDTWHLYRAGTDYSTISQVIARGSIFIVELDDGGAKPQGTLWDDTIDHRRYPGDGAFNVPDFIRAVSDAGFDGYWGVEIISEQHRALPITEGLAAAARATRASLAAAGFLDSTSGDRT